MMNICKKMILAGTIFSAVAVSPGFAMMKPDDIYNLPREQQVRELTILCDTPEGLYKYLNELADLEAPIDYYPRFKNLLSLKPKNKCHGRAVAYAIILDDSEFFNRVFTYRRGMLPAVLEVSLYTASVDIASYMVKYYVGRDNDCNRLLLGKKFLKNLVYYSTKEIKTIRQGKRFLELLGYIDEKLPKNIIDDEAYVSGNYVTAYKNSFTKYGFSALHQAASAGNYAFVEVLLENGFDVNAKAKFGYEGKTALEIAADSLLDQIKKDYFFQKDYINNTVEQELKTLGSTFEKYRLTIELLLKYYSKEDEEYIGTVSDLIDKASRTFANEQSLRIKWTRVNFKEVELTNTEKIRITEAIEEGLRGILEEFPEEEESML